MKRLLILLLLLGLPCYAVTEYTIGNMQNMETQELIKILDEQDIKTQKDFEIYYTNLLNYLKTGNSSTWGDIPFSTEHANDDIKRFFAQENYNAPIIKVDEGHAVWVSMINYQYLYDNYENILSQAWKDYLLLNINEYNQINKDKDVPTGYYYEGISYDISLIPDFIIARRNFINKYPDFSFNWLNEKQIKWFLSDLIDDKWQIHDFSNTYPNKLNDKTKTTYKRALNLFEKDSFEYQILNEWYNLLRENHFKFTKDVTNRANNGWVWFLDSQD